ncbi:MAG: hypothetical protein KME17_24375 [Cyanosarcina radialis HA8281-LM2]|jgi:nitrate/nitrite-specific signal transduction histidine kinase|nr:hypothetical protein [Cyanosarcina radialis HA8281-LM2]
MSSISPLLKEQLENLTPEQKQEVLKLLKKPVGVSPEKLREKLQQFVGRIKEDDLEKMERAVEECRQIDN